MITIKLLPSTAKQAAEELIKSGGETSDYEVLYHLYWLARDRKIEMEFVSDKTYNLDQIEDNIDKGIDMRPKE